MIYDNNKTKKGDSFMENKTEGKGFWLILSALVVIAASSVYFVYKLMSDKAYNEKWQDYDECGIM